MLAIRARELVKRFGTTTALDGVTLELAPGEVRGLLGPNGAGKTTLLRLLFGLVAPDAGEVHLLGRRLEHLGGDALQAVGGFVEEPAFYPYLSGRANLALLSRLDGSGAPPSEIDAVLARAGLLERGGDRVGGYSTGMRQRLGIAAALLRRPRLLLLDEPTSGLDPAGARAVASLVGELASDGVAVLVSSHQIGELERICDTFTFLRGGRVVWDGTAGELEAQAPVSAYALTTPDPERVLALAGERPGVRAQLGSRGAVLVSARPADLDAIVFALGDERIPLRRLELLVSPLEAMFFALTSGEEPGVLHELAPSDLTALVLAGAR